MARGAVKRHTPRTPVAIGLIALVIILVLTFLGFTKDIPFTTPFQVKATFQSANSIRTGAPASTSARSPRWSRTATPTPRS
jgi:ABC-type transporter Mla subunit MlaD